MKIENTPKEAIKTSIKYICKLIGIRENNFPTESEQDFLVSQIEKLFPKVELSNIILAFEMAASGYIEFSFTQSFSIPLIGKMLSLYKSHSSTENHTGQIDELSIEQIEELNIRAYKKTHLELQNNLLEPKKMISTWAGIFYDRLSMDYSVPDYKNELNRAEKILKRQSYDGLYDGFDERNVNDIAKKIVICEMWK